MLVHDDDDGHATVFAIIPCVVCGRPFRCNPARVPSVRDPRTGRRDGVCRPCLLRVNAARSRAGLEPHAALPGAYEPGTEESVFGEAVSDDGAPWSAS